MAKKYKSNYNPGKILKKNKNVPINEKFENNNSTKEIKYTIEKNNDYNKYEIKNNNNLNKEKLYESKISNGNNQIGEENNKDLRKFLKKKIRDINYKNIISFFLEEYTETSIINKFFNILSLKKIKIIYHSLMILYNFYLNKNKAIASAILTCISLIND